MQSIVDRIRTEPAVFWGTVATVAIGIYHLVVPSGTQDAEISTLVSTLGPLVTSIVIRFYVSPAENPGL